MQEFTCKYCGCVTELNTKTNRENKYFHGVLVPHFKKALERMGYSFTREECRQYIKQRFFAYKKNGVLFVQSFKNTDHNTKDWEDKMEEIRQWVNEKLDNYIIPLPNEMDMNE